MGEIMIHALFAGNSENSDIDPNKHESKERRYKEKIQEEHLKKVVLKSLSLYLIT